MCSSETGTDLLECVDSAGLGGTGARVVEDSATSWDAGESEVDSGGIIAGGWLPLIAHLSRTGYVRPTPVGADKKVPQRA